MDHGCDRKKLLEPLLENDFYHGVNRGFSAIEQELDVRRKRADTILADQGATGVKYLAYLPD